MSDLDPTTRFTGLAGIYAQSRPSYPAQAIDFIIKTAGLSNGSTVVDVGCGTGISSRLLTQRGCHVIGIEPNEHMRSQAEATSIGDTEPKPIYQEGGAEATGLPDSCCQAVLAAQAFHWFEVEKALSEFHRILKPGGWAFLMWNERDHSDEFTAGFGSIVGASAHAQAVEGNRTQAGEHILGHPLFESFGRVSFDNSQTVDEEGLLGRAFSASYAPSEANAVQKFTSDLRALFAHWQQGGQVVIRYQTSIFYGRRAEQPTNGL